MRIKSAVIKGTMQKCLKKEKCYDQLILFAKKEEFWTKNCLISKFLTKKSLSNFSWKFGPPKSYFTVWIKNISRLCRCHMDRLNKRRKGAWMSIQSVQRLVTILSIRHLVCEWYQSQIRDRDMKTLVASRRDAIGLWQKYRVRDSP